MKKIVFLVLVLVFGFNTLSAEEVTMKFEEFYYIFDNDTKKSSKTVDIIKSLPDYKVVAILMSTTPDTLGSLDVYFDDVLIIECNELVKKYNYVKCYDDCYNVLIIYQNIGNGKMIELRYVLR